MPVSPADVRGQPPRLWQVALADVEQHEHRLLAQEPEASDRLLLVRVQRHVAHRVALDERLVDPRQDHFLALVGLAFGGRAMAAGGLESFDASLGHREVGEHELEVEALQVPPRVDAALRVRHGVALERADDVEQRVGIPQPREVLRR
jgi:hypothetical protein